MNRRELKTTAKQSVRNARGSVKPVTLALILSVLALTALEWAVTMLSERSGGGTHYLSQAISAQTRAYVIVALVSLIFQFLLVLLAVGYQALSLRLSRNEEFSMDILLEGFRVWGRAVLLYLYISVILGLWAAILSMPPSYVLAGLYMSGSVSEDMMFLLMSGYMALVMLILSYRYRMAYFILLDSPEKSIRQIITEAKAITQTHRWQLFLLDLSFVPWLLLCVLTCGVLLIWKLPYLAATYAHAYRHMLDDYAIRQRRMEELLAEQQERFRQNRFF